MTEKISVITIVKDHEKGLVATLESLISQSYLNWESIIVVGESKDGTLAEAVKFSSEIKSVQVINQISSGIYQAMNNGIDAATGKYLVFMNAGDIFSNSNSLSEMSASITELECGLVIGGYRVLGGEKALSFSKKKISSLKFAFNLKFGCHQAMIFSRQAVVDLSGYDTFFRLCADYKLILEVLKKESGVRVENIFAGVEPGGISDRSLVNVHSEKHDIRMAFFGKMIWLPSSIWKVLILFRIKTKNHD